MPKKFLWGAVVNLGGGLLTEKPKKFFYNEEFGNWYSSNNQDEVECEGLNVEDGYTTFTSHNKQEVEAFINGVKALRDILLHYTLYRKKS